MNLRILKKLSKRAAPYLPKIGYTGEFFLAEKGENYTKTIIRDRSCWERYTSVHGDLIGELDRKWLARNPDNRGRFIWCGMKPPSHPLKGTPMVGETSGYYEPEWDEETAWDALRSFVWSATFDYDNGWQTTEQSTPSAVFRLADELLSGKRIVPGFRALSQETR